MKTGRIVPLFACFALAAAMALAAAPAADRRRPATPAPATRLPPRMPTPPRARSGPSTRISSRRASATSPAGARTTCAKPGRRSAQSAACSLPARRGRALRALVGGRAPTTATTSAAFSSASSRSTRSATRTAPPMASSPGYYEPLLNGSRRYGQRFVYPVYGIPDNLLFLDSRSIPASPTARRCSRASRAATSFPLRGPAGAARRASVRSCSTSATPSPTSATRRSACASTAIASFRTTRAWRSSAARCGQARHPVGQRRRGAVFDAGAGLRQGAHAGRADRAPRLRRAERPSVQSARARGPRKGRPRPDAGHRVPRTMTTC